LPPNRYYYKEFPIETPNPAFPDKLSSWRPALNIGMMYKHSRVIPVNCIVDTGSNYCLFRADLAKPIGIDITKGKEYVLGGISRQIKETFYFHSVKLVIAGSTIETNVGFSPHLPVAGVLGF